jgi:hypothetical protein
MGQQNNLQEELTRLVVQHIVSRVGRRISGLMVSYCDDRVTVRGTAESYHVWQLAIAACRELQSEMPSVHFDCHFQIERLFAARKDRVPLPI